MIRVDPILKIDLEDLLGITMEEDPHHPFVAWLPSTRLVKHRYILFQMRRRSRCGFWHPTNVEILASTRLFSRIKRRWDNETDKWITNICRTPRCLCLIDTRSRIPDILSIAYFEKQREGYHIK